MKLSKWKVSCSLLGLVTLAAMSTAASAVDMRDDVNPRTLCRFTFEGLPLGSSVGQLKKQFPAAEAITDELDRKLSRERFVVSDLKVADTARFFFVDNKMYQIEVTYKESRLLQLGGIETVRRQLVTQLGAADHAGESRWTWQQPNCNRRADLFGMPDGALLVVTELSLIPVIEQRTKRVVERDDLGF